MKTTKEIQAATINRVSDKSGKFLGYLVKSNSSENYYQVTYNTSANRYECNCVATCKCCHIKAVEQVQAVRVESQKQGTTSPATTEIVNVTMGNTTISEPISNLGNAVAHHIWAKKMLAEVKEDAAEKAEREARLQREADAMVEQAHRKYDAPLNGNRGFSLLRV